jgi:hypothetical protein
MSELDEISNNKNIKQLETELAYQLSQGESLGGTICSHFSDLIEKLKQKSKEIEFNQTNKKHHGI